VRPASYALFLIVDIGHNSKFGHDYSKLPTTEYLHGLHGCWGGFHGPDREGFCGYGFDQLLRTPGCDRLAVGDLASSPALTTTFAQFLDAIHFWYKAASMITRWR
jgi:hypothetical protein